ncbi:MAG: heavy-metal-associated domain-containing protein [Microbacteriaceae bacterium]|jgi:copper chaperone
MTTVVSSVQGMTCQHCVGSVTTEVGAIPGVTGVDIELHPKGLSLVTIETNADISDEVIRAAIAEAGYETQGDLRRS